MYFHWTWNYSKLVWCTSKLEPYVVPNGISKESSNSQDPNNPFVFEIHCSHKQNFFRAEETQWKLKPWVMCWVRNQVCYKTILPLLVEILDQIFGFSRIFLVAGFGLNLKLVGPKGSLLQCQFKTKRLLFKVENSECFSDVLYKSFVA